MKQLYRHNDTIYILRDSKLIHFFCKRLEDQPDMTFVREYMEARGADHVLRTNTHFLFCETIPDQDFEIVE